jgi:hypothetical protein
MDRQLGIRLGLAFLTVGASAAQTTPKFAALRAPRRLLS